MAKFQSKLTKLGYLNMHVIIVPSYIKQEFSYSNKERFHVTVNDLISFQGGLMNYQNGSSYIMMNAKNINKLKIKEGDLIEISLEPDTSSYGIQMPEELQEILDSDEEGNLRFQNLTDGKKRYIINFVNVLKSSEGRVNRGLQIIENLKSSPKGKETAKYLLYGR